MGYFHEDIDIYLLDKDYELLYIDTASGDINLENLTCYKLEINSASGSTTGKYIQADNLNVDVSSGNVDIMGDFFNVGIDMASGDAKIDSGIMLDTLDIESSSGNVVVFLPEDKNGFTLNYSKASGEITSEFPLTGTLDSMDGSAVYAGGKYKYSIDIASGDVEFRKPI